MSSYLLADQLLQHALNAFISFLLFALLTEGCMWLFNIRNYRLRACFRLLPPIKLALEPLFWLLPSGATIVNTGIFSCSHPLQRFLFERLSDSAQQELTLHGLKTVSGKLLLMVPTPLIYVGVVSVAAVSLYQIATLTMQSTTSITHIKGIRQRGIIDSRPIYNEKLLQQLQKQRTKIVISREVKVPLAGWGNCIIVPKDLADELSQNEFESVLSHELEHHRWRDTMVRMVYRTVAAVYWWVPMTKWLHKLEHEQELASDVSVHRYELNGLDLATALKKTVRRQQLNHYQCAAFARKTTTTRGKALFERLKAALNPCAIRKQNKVSAVTGTIIMLGLVLILGFVIC